MMDQVNDDSFTQSEPESFNEFEDGSLDGDEFMIFQQLSSCSMLNKFELTNLLEERIASAGRTGTLLLYNVSGTTWLLRACLWYRNWRWKFVQRNVALKNSPTCWFLLIKFWFCFFNEYDFFIRRTSVVYCTFVLSIGK